MSLFLLHERSIGKFPALPSRHHLPANTGFLKAQAALPSLAPPCGIEFRDMLPKSKVGKMLRREIRDEERRKSTG